MHSEVKAGLLHARVLRTILSGWTATVQPVLELTQVCDLFRPTDY